MNIDNELRFLLKEKYKVSGTRLEELINEPQKRHEIPGLNKDIEQLQNYYPVDYLIGNKPFLNINIDLRYKPLIPRTETEHWVEKALQTIPQTNKLKCLDIFCGSGCIGIAIMANNPKLTMDFSDYYDNAVKQTKLNLELNQIATNRYHVFQSDVFKNIPISQYDYIFANPPYVGHQEKVGKEIEHEPSEAIFSGINGTEIISEFLTEAHNYLTPKTGLIYMEFGWGQKEKIEALIKNFPLYETEFHQDQYSRWRYVKIFLN